MPCRIIEKGKIAIVFVVPSGLAETLNEAIIIDFWWISRKLIFRLQDESFSFLDDWSNRRSTHFLKSFTFLINISCISDSCSSATSQKQHTMPKRAHVFYIFPRNFFHILAKLTISIAINVPKACLIMNELTSDGDWMREKDGNRKKFFFIDQFEWQFTTNCIKRFIWSRAARLAFMVNLLGWRIFESIRQKGNNLRLKGFGS